MAMPSPLSQLSPLQQQAGSLLGIANQQLQQQLGNLAQNVASQQLQTTSQKLPDPMSRILGGADVATTLAQFNEVVAKMQSNLSIMQGVLRDMGSHQSLLLGYIHYLNPDDGERPAEPMNYAEWSRLQQVSDVINLAKAARA
jgi:uncharacterized protein YigA (DUF484 family)